MISVFLLSNFLFQTERRDDRGSPSSSASSSSSSLCSGHLTLPVACDLWPPPPVTSDLFTQTEEPLPSGCRKQQQHHNRWQKRLQFFLFLSVFHLLFCVLYAYLVLFFCFFFSHNQCCQCSLLFFPSCCHVRTYSTDSGQWTLRGASTEPWKDYQIGSASPYGIKKGRLKY